MPKEKDPPNKDKDLPQEGPEDLIGDSPPDIGQGEVIPEDEFVPGVTPPPPDTGQGEQVILSPELKGLMVKKGYKDINELGKAYENLEKSKTESDKNLRLQTIQPQPQQPLPQEPPPQLRSMPELPKEPYEMTKEEFNEHQRQRDEVSRQNMVTEYQYDQQNKERTRVQAEAYGKIAEDPKRFARLKSTMGDLYSQNPYGYQNFEHLMDEAERVDNEQKEEKKKEFIKDVFGENAEVDQIKALMSKARPVTVATGSGGGQQQIITEKTDQQVAADKVWEGILLSDTLRD